MVYCICDNYPNLMNLFKNGFHSDSIEYFLIHLGILMGAGKLTSFYMTTWNDLHRSLHIYHRASYVYFFSVKL